MRAENRIGAQETQVLHILSLSSVARGNVDKRDMEDSQESRKTRSDVSNTDVSEGLFIEWT